MVKLCQLPHRPCAVFVLFLLLLFLLNVLLGQAGLGRVGWGGVRERRRGGGIVSKDCPDAACLLWRGGGGVHFKGIAVS